MSMPIENVVRDHLRANDAVQDTIDWDEIVTRADTPKVVAGSSGPVRSRGLLVLAIAVLVVGLVGAIPLVLRSTEQTPPATQPGATTNTAETAEPLLLTPAQDCLLNGDGFDSVPTVDCPDHMVFIETVRVYRVGESCLAVEVLLSREIEAELDSSMGGVYLNAVYGVGTLLASSRHLEETFPKGHHSFIFVSPEIEGGGADGDLTPLVAIGEARRLFLIPSLLDFADGDTDPVDSYTIPDLPDKLWVEVESQTPSGYFRHYVEPLEAQGGLWASKPIAQWNATSAWAASVDHCQLDQ